MDRYLYHITPKRNVHSIKQKGIIPAANNEGITTKYGKQHDQVFLTNDVERILSTQCGSDWLEHNPVAILVIDTEGLVVKPHEYHGGGTYSISDFEYTTGKITPDRIVEINYRN